MPTNNPYIGKSKEQLMKNETSELRDEAEKRAWVELVQYFDGKGNGPAAKVACVVVGTTAKERQSANNARSLDLISQRMGLHSQKVIPRHTAEK